MSVAHGIAQPPRQICGPPCPSESQVNECRYDHAANGGGQRRERTPRGREGAARQRRLEDLLRGEREEEDHADVVYDEMQRMRDAVIAARVHVCPHHRNGGTDE